MRGWEVGIVRLIWYAIVVMKHLNVLHMPAPRKKKKLAAKFPFLLRHSTTVCMIANFPKPAGPLSQQIG